MNNIKKLLDNLKNKNNEEYINNTIDKAINTISRVYSGEGKNKSAIHINDALKETSNIVNDIIKVYDELCEYVHPNYSGNLLISSGILGKGKIDVKKANHEIIEKLIIISYKTIEILKRNTFYYPTLTWKLHEYVERCFQKNAKLTNIFSEKKAKPKNDGKSIETAFYFDKARTSQEALRLMYKFFEEIGYTPNQKDRQQILDKKSLSEGFHIDKWDTPKGIFYFKTKSYHGL